MITHGRNFRNSLRAIGAISPFVNRTGAALAAAMDGLYSQGRDKPLQDRAEASMHLSSIKSWGDAQRQPADPGKVALPSGRMWPTRQPTDQATSVVPEFRPGIEDRRNVPIKIPDDLPARSILETEGVAVMRESDAVRQDIRPLRIGLLNLMPDKVSTETQLARLLGATPLQIELTLVRISDHVARNTSAEHLEAFYRPWRDVEHERFDGFIVTGAPVERLAFEDVRYWPELRRIFDWTRTHVHSCLTICWAAQAFLHHFHGVPKHELPAKAFGVFPHRNRAPNSPFLRGISDRFAVPVSRWTQVREADLPEGHGLRVLADSEETGLCLLHDPADRAVLMFNHLEYDGDTLANEYHRDRGLVPANYYPNDDPAEVPVNSWRSHGHLFFSNWINEIYQTVPFDPAEIGAIPHEADPTDLEPA